MDHQVLQVLQEHKVLQVPKVHKVYQAHQDLLVLQEFLE